MRWVALVAGYVALACSGRAERELQPGPMNSAGTSDSAGTSGSAGTMASAGAASGGSAPDEPGTAGTTSLAGSEHGTAGSASATNQSRIFIGYGSPKVDECDADWSCPEGKVCFRLTAELGVCDTAQPTESTECSPASNQLPNLPSGECGCNGWSCGAGQVCRAVEPTCSCPVLPFNTCVDAACASATDCGDGMVCTPSSYILPGPYSEVGAIGRCFMPDCKADADCTDSLGGLCMLLLQPPNQAGEQRLDGVRCIYATDRD